jgi:C4-dicarboxylate-binding protein DctP
MKKSGKTQLITPTPAQTAAMRKAMEPVYADVSKRVGKNLIDEVLKETQGVTH